MNYTKKELKNASSSKNNYTKRGVLKAGRINNKTHELDYNCVDCDKKLHNHICYAYNHKFRCGNCFNEYTNKKERKQKNPKQKIYTFLSYYKKKYNFQYELKNGLITYLCVDCGKLVSNEPLFTAYSKKFKCDDCIKEKTKEVKKQIKENLTSNVNLSNNEVKLVDKIINSNAFQSNPYGFASITIRTNPKEDDEHSLEKEEISNNEVCFQEENKIEKSEEHLEDYWNIKDPKEMTMFEKFKRMFFKEKYSEFSIDIEDIRKTEYKDGKLIITFVKDKSEIKNINELK